MTIPEHFIHIHGPMYMDPEANDILSKTPDSLNGEWIKSALEALSVLATDLSGWTARAKYRGQLALRIQMGDTFVNDRVFDHDSLPEFAESPLASFVDAVAKANGSGELWSDSENHLGGDIATRLAERSLHRVLSFVRFLESNDLDHEVSQGWHISRVIQAHGWTPETMALWVARLGTCAGQHGHETEWEKCCVQTIGDFVASKDEHRELLVQLISGNMVADQRELKHDVEHHLAVLQNDTLDIFWDDLDEQGLGDLAGPIVEEAYQKARAVIHQYAGNQDAPPHWLSVL